MNKATVGCAVLGYGPIFNWGWMHARWIQGVDDLQLLAICDKDPECAAKARQDYPEADVTTNMQEMLC
ncbi:MAG: hypothetical protein QF437_30265, partial [Planctomycetota bacterium]|nr:hypothetical protein [Planctomycetota bacterium]